MPKPTDFIIACNSGHATGDNEFAVLYDADEMRGYHTRVTCTLDELDGHIADAVAKFPGVRHSQKEGPLDGERDPANDIVVVTIVMPKGVRKPPGFNSRPRTQRFPFPERVTA